MQHVSAGHQGAEEAGGISTSSELQPPQIHLQVKHSLQLQLGINKTANTNIFFPFLSFLFARFLDEVQSYSGVNKMSVQNLATVFGPNILRPKVEDPVAIMEGEQRFVVYHRDWYLTSEFQKDSRVARYGSGAAAHGGPHRPPRRALPPGRG